VRYAVAIALASLALGGAVYFASLRLDTRTLHYRNCAELGLPPGMTCGSNRRATWQFPVAVAIAALGVAGAVGVLKRN
jgi:hypothetical protein